MTTPILPGESKYSKGRTTLLPYLKFAFGGAVGSREEALVGGQTSSSLDSSSFSDRASGAGSATPQSITPGPSPNDTRSQSTTDTAVPSLRRFVTSLYSRIRQSGPSEEFFDIPEGSM